MGQLQRLDFTPEQWGRWVVENAGLRRPALRRVTAAVGNTTPEDRAVRAALTALGCKLEEKRVDKKR